MHDAHHQTCHAQQTTHHQTCHAQQTTLALATRHSRQQDVRSHCTRQSETHLRNESCVVIQRRGKLGGRHGAACACACGRTRKVGSRGALQRTLVDTASRLKPRAWAQIRFPTLQPTNQRCFSLHSHTRGPRGPRGALPLSAKGRHYTSPKHRVIALAITKSSIRSTRKESTGTTVHKPLVFSSALAGVLCCVCKERAYVTNQFTLHLRDSL